MDVYPYRFEPIYVEKIWGGRSLERLFGRPLPAGASIGESWELADLTQGVSAVANGPASGTSLTELTRRLGADLLGRAEPMPDGRFPLLLKLLDANDILSMQVHPDAEAVAAIGAEAALKTESWYVLESRDGMIYKGTQPGATPRAFREAIETDTVERVVRRIDVVAGDFHFLPAGTVHALGAGVVVAEVQTPPDTTFRVERPMQCIHFEPAGNDAPGADGETLLVTDFFTVARRTAAVGESAELPGGRCAALMVLDGGPVEIRHVSEIEPAVALRAGDAVLLPAALREARLVGVEAASWLEVTLPEQGV